MHVDLSELHFSPVSRPTELGLEVDLPSGAIAALDGLQNRFH